jgi:soluble lytic murein transglycosylase-like protein
MKNRATSWGLMQVMGQSARELGYREFIPELCDPASGLYWGCKIFTRKLECTGGDYQKALQLWNGGGNPNYAAEVMARAPKYKT